MSCLGIASVLAEQLLVAKARAALAQAQGQDARSIESIDRSLRQTLCCIAQLQDPRRVAAKGFSLVVNAAGEALVRHQDRALPVSSVYLQSLLEEAGVVLRPGQVLLLDAVLVRLLVEEALGAVGREEVMIRDAKSRLIHASLEADTLEKGPSPQAESCPREAA